MPCVARCGGLAISAGLDGLEGLTRSWHADNPGGSSRRRQAQTAEMWGFRIPIPYPTGRQESGTQGRRKYAAAWRNQAHPLRVRSGPRTGRSRRKSFLPHARVAQWHQARRTGRGGRTLRPAIGLPLDVTAILARRTPDLPVTTMLGFEPWGIEKYKRNIINK